MTRLCKYNKILYINRREAVAVIKLHSIKTVQPYKCKYCDYWHLGNKIAKKSPVGRIVKIERKKRKAMKLLLNLVDELSSLFSFDNL